MSIDSTYSCCHFCLRAFFALKKQNDEQMATKTATISRANVVLRPVSASLRERVIPRKFTLLSVSVGGAVVPVEKKLRLLH